MFSCTFPVEVTQRAFCTAFHKGFMGSFLKAGVRYEWDVVGWTAAGRVNKLQSLGLFAHPSPNQAPFLPFPETE